MTIGEKLRSAREANHLSLVELQEKTKIQLRYLEAIENDQFKSLPGEYNTKLFLRSYARCVGIDPDEIIREYNGEPIREYQDAYEKQETRGSRYEQNQGGNKKSKVSKLIPPIILSLVFLIIIGSVAYAFVKEHDRFAANSDVQSEYSVSSVKDEAKNSQTQASTAPSEEKTVVKQSKPKPKMKMDVVSSTMNSVTMQVKNVDKKASIVLDGVQGRCWVSALASNKSLYQGVVELGQKETLDVPAGTKQVVLQLGNAPMLKMKLNNKVIDYETEQVTSKQVTLTLNLSYQS